MTIYIFILKGDFNGENRSGAFLFLSGIVPWLHLCHNVHTIGTASANSVESDLGCT